MKFFKKLFCIGFYGEKALLCHPTFISYKWIFLNLPCIAESSILLGDNCYTAGWQQWKVKLLFFSVFQILFKYLVGIFDNGTLNSGSNVLMVDESADWSFTNEYTMCTCTTYSLTNSASGSGSVYIYYFAFWSASSLGSTCVIGLSSGSDSLQQNICPIFRT